MGRPHKCPACGAEGKSVSKGARRTKTMGVRRIRLCKACGHKFTPKNQKPGEVSAPPASERESASAPVADSSSTPVPTSDEASAHGSTDEVIDHPRF